MVNNVATLSNAHCLGIVIFPLCNSIIVAQGSKQENRL